MSSKKTLFWFMTLFLMIATSLIVLEVALKFWNPLNLRLSPKLYYQYQSGQNHSYSLIYRNKFISLDKMDPFVKIQRNSIGFRGEEPPQNPKKYLRIIAMGGSTTECIVLSDGTTWSDLLQKKISLNRENVWVGNAGVNGQSTWGHLSYLTEAIVQMKPDIILFLIGGNEQNLYYLADDSPGFNRDFGLDKSKRYNKVYNYQYKGPQKKSLKTKFFVWIEKNKNKSWILLNISELRRRYLSRKILFGYKEIDFEKFKENHSQEEWGELVGTVTDFMREREIDLRALDQKERDSSRVKSELFKQAEHMQNVRRQIHELIKISRKNGILPVFITQPALFGEGIDPSTGVNLSNMVLQNGNVGWGQGLSGKEMWEMLEAYNDITREVTKEEGVKLIDLARTMEKDSKYYYDFVHYSKPGAKRVAELIYKELCPEFCQAQDKAL